MSCRFKEVLDLKGCVLNMEGLRKCDGMGDATERGWLVGT